MSNPIAASPDLHRLAQEGYSLEIQGRVVLIRDVPYIAPDRSIQRGVMATELAMLGDRAGPPPNHTVWWVGTMPQRYAGGQIDSIWHSNAGQMLEGSLSVDRMFSCYPVATGVYTNYYDKFRGYLDIIVAEAWHLDHNVTAQLFRQVVEAPAESVFEYTDTASIRTQILPVVKKLENKRLAIFGTGGTGSYILDFLAKTPASAIHLFDKDHFAQHNAFRSPGAATIEQLRAQPQKVNYLKERYSAMHRKIVTHDGNLDEACLASLPELDFAFIALDHGPTRKLIAQALVNRSVPFVDATIGLALSPRDALFGTCTTTFVGPGDQSALSKLYFADDSADELYATPIQVAELNCLSACQAVIRWKKFAGFFEDGRHEWVSDYVIDHQATHVQERPDADD